MTNPQTLAEQIGYQAVSIGKYGCLAFCYMYCVGINPDDEGRAIKLVSDAIKAKVIDADCTVYDASKYIQWLTGKHVEVIKDDNFIDISKIKDATPVCYTRNGYEHWVVVENGKIVFNSIERSNCVMYGKPCKARYIKRNEGV